VRDIGPDDRVEYYRVGSTDLCGKHCVPFERCGCNQDAFFIELPVDLAVPYRNFIVTGIEGVKRDVTPDGKWAHGSPENCGDPSCDDCEHAEPKRGDVGPNDREWF
jgi:hypothetical protein